MRINIPGQTAALLLLCILPAFPVTAQQQIITVDMLVADLASADDARQVRARQLLPLRGAAAAEKIVPLLNDERDLVYFAALRVLEDIIHEANDSEKESVAQTVFSLIAPDTSERQKNVGLRLLPLVVQEKNDLSAVAVLLKDTHFREPARRSLEAMGTQNAILVLCAALSQVEESFQIDILHALLACDMAAHTQYVIPLLEAANPAIQAAALRTLAKTGSPSLLPHAHRIAAASNENAWEAWDGYLQLVDAIALRGGHYETAIAAYRKILNTTPHLLIKSGAISGMGRFGDAAIIPLIVETLQGQEGDKMEAAALEAFHTMTGHAVNRALIEAFPSVSNTMKPAMISLLGKKANLIFLPLLQENVRHENPGIRNESWAALAQSGLPEAVAVFQQFLAEDRMDTEEREAVIQHLYKIALTLQEHANNEGAGKAYLTLYRHTKDAELRAAALDGIRAFPVAEAYDVVLELLENNDLENLPINLMVGVAVNALAAGREEEGRKLMREIMPRLTTTDAVRRAIDAMRTQKPNPEFARALGYITQWYLAGPFHWNKGDAFEGVFIGEPQISLTDSYSEDEKTLAWQLHTSNDTSALFNLMGLLGPIDSAVAFAYIEIEAAEDGPAQIRVGSDDGIRAWVNNEEVLQINIDRGYAIDQNISDITLKQGKNVILMQITQIAGGWAFAARLTYPDGTPLEFTIVEQ